MKYWPVSPALVLTFLATVVLWGCRQEDSQVSPVAPTAPAPPPQIDRSLVGAWYRLGSYGGILFKADGTWESLEVRGNRIYEPGYYDRFWGSFTNPRAGECIFAWSPSFSAAGVAGADTCGYAFTDDGSSMSVEHSNENFLGDGKYVRTAIGEVVIPL